MRMGLNIEYDGRNYDILELPVEAFVHLIPGLTDEQYRRIDARFYDCWPEPTVRRNHIIGFASELMGASIDLLLHNRHTIEFDEDDLFRYLEEHCKQGYRPS